MSMPASESTVGQPRLGPWKRATVVGHHHDHGIVDRSLGAELIHHLADEPVEPRDLVGMRLPITCPDPATIA
jgi:hypothetical protein